MTSETETAERKTRKSAGAWLAAILFGATIAAGGAAAVVALHARAAIEPAGDVRERLIVVTAPLQITDRYMVRHSYVGRIEAARETSPAFERAGLVLKVLVDEGDEVGAGEVLAELDTESLEIERARLVAERASIEADLELAERTAERRKRLKDRGFESGQSYDEARFSVASLKAKLEAIGASLARIALDLEKSTLTAPFAGVVASRAIDEGTVVAAGTELMRIQETARPQARIGVPPELAAEMEAGMTLKILSQGGEISGRLRAVAPDLEPETRTVSLLIDLDPETYVTMGQVARLQLDRPVDSRGAWVPLTALQEATRGLWSIHTVIPDAEGQVISREAVEILHVSGERAYVRGSFRDGAAVVVEGPHRLTLGQAVLPIAGKEG